MASINIQIWDATSGKLQEVELPDNAPVNRIIPVLLDKMNLPKNGSDGQPLDYKLYLEANGVQLLGTQCLADVGVKDGTVIRLQPLSINSKPLHNKGTNLIPKLWIGGIAIVAIIAIFIVCLYVSFHTINIREP